MYPNMYFLALALCIVFLALLCIRLGLELWAMQKTSREAISALHRVNELQRGEAKMLRTICENNTETVRLRARERDELVASLMDKLREILELNERARVTVSFGKVNIAEDILLLMEKRINSIVDNLPHPVIRVSVGETALEELSKEAGDCPHCAECKGSENPDCRSKA